MVTIFVHFAQIYSLTIIPFAQNAEILAPQGESVDFKRLVCYTTFVKLSAKQSKGKLGKNMTTRAVEIKNRIGLHASYASFFIQEACSYQSSIWVEKGDRKMNAKSLLGVLSLGIKHGEVVTLIADGADESAALEGLANLVENKLAD